MSSLMSFNHLNHMHGLFLQLATDFPLFVEESEDTVLHVWTGWYGTSHSAADCMYMLCLFSSAVCSWRGENNGNMRQHIPLTLKVPFKIIADQMIIYRYYFLFFWKKYCLTFHEKKFDISCELTWNDKLYFGRQFTCKCHALFSWTFLKKLSLLSAAVVTGTLILCMLGNFACFFCCLIFFLNQLFPEKTFRNTIKVSNSLDPDQAWHFVRSDLDPNCLQRLSADDKSCHQWGKS